VGAFALEQGFIFTAMILSAATVSIIERHFRQASAWCAVAAPLSAFGLMHAYRWTPGDTAIELRPAWEWVSATRRWPPCCWRLPG
jgi:AGZA family xanthine/uracil permease-like MFS transporter